MTTTDIRAWPTLSAAARMLGVAPSTLSRLPGIVAERVGVQQRRVSPATVMRLARHYRRRVVEEVAHDLVARARLEAPELVSDVQGEIDRALAETAPTSLRDADAFLRAAQSFLPTELFELVRSAVSTPGVSRGVLTDGPRSSLRTTGTRKAAVRDSARPGRGTPKRATKPDRAREPVPA